MAPPGAGKRKRGDRTFSQDSRDEGQRPSPHRPNDLSLGQHNLEPRSPHFSSYGRDNFDQRGGGFRGRGGRGGRGRGSQRSPVTTPNNTSFPPKTQNLTSEPTPAIPSTSSQKSATATQTQSISQPAPSQSQPTSSQTQEPESETKQSAPSPYSYDYVTDEMLESWQSSERSSIIDRGKAARQEHDKVVLGAMYQEIIHAGLHNRLDPSDAGSVIREIIQEGTESGIDSSGASNEGDDAASYFLDVLSIVAEYAPYSAKLYTLVTATHISASKMRRELDSGLLENLGLVRKNVFVRVGIRQQTNLLYRQSNYNLLREETEGYSKLITDLFTTSSDEPPTGENVEETFERVKGMIGAFDLDVGRVLDISLDVFASVLVKQYRFFVKYLRSSSWWPHDMVTSNQAKDRMGPLPWWGLPGASMKAPSEAEREALKAMKVRRDEAFWDRAREVGFAAFFELGGRRAEPSALEQAVEAAASLESSEIEEERKWIQITKTLPPAGNKVAAQVLGFKLRFYNSQARDPSDTLPVNLIYLAALLVKIGFVSLKDLYPHIWPTDEAMEVMREEKMKEKAEREKLNRPGGGAPNALLAAAPLPDDTIEGQGREATRLREVEAARRQAAKSNNSDDIAPTAQIEDKDELPEPSEQKVQLLKSLLSIGALPEALYMLGRFPWLLDGFPELPEYIHRILHHSLSKIYEPLRPLQNMASLQEEQKVPDADQSGVLKGQIRLTEAPPRRRKRWAQLDQDNVNEKDEVVDYKFYWDEWADMLPVCQTIDDLFTLCSTLLNLSGVKIGQDPTLLMKIARIGNFSLSNDRSTPNSKRWIDLSKRLLVPALSFTKCNPGVVNEVFELIKNFSYQTRFSIYAEWYQGQVSRQPDIKSAFEQARAETKDVLKRISKTTIKPMARALAKVAYASPGVVFSVAIAQLESYENIVDAVVECARYFTYLAYDVLTWSLLSALGGQGRNRVQADGMLTSKWLAALSLFAGKIFKRYSVMNPTPIVQYVAEQLRRASSADLIVLEEITKSMAGIVSDSSLNDQQVLAMAGGELLQAQTMLQLHDRRHESKTTARRLMKSLTDSRLAGQILVSLAQERQTCIFKIEERDAHPKLLGNLVDQLHRIFVQYNDLLRGNLSTQEFDQFVPSVVQLVSQFGVDPNIAFWICRPSITALIAEYDAKYGISSSENRDVVKDTTDDAKMTDLASPEPKDTEMKDATLMADSGDTVSLSLETQAPKSDSQDVAIQDAGNEPLESGTTKSEAIPQPWHPVLKEIMDGLEFALPNSIWDSISPAFFVTFWQCSLRDMYLPLQSYESEIKQIGKRITGINADRSDLSILGSQRKEKEKKTLNDLQDRLQQESRQRLQDYSAVRKRLQKEKDQWFAGFWQKWDALNIALIEHCFFPRILLSALDAKYTFRMLKYLHASGAANFRTMGVYDQLFRDQRLTSLIFLCSAKESEYFGRFLNEVLRDLGRWHADRAIFEKEAYGIRKDLPGFSKKLGNDKTILSFYDHESFRRVLFKWHRNLSNALKTCLTSQEYMHIRNAINILNNVHQNFPAVTFMGQHQLTSITEISQTETREDLKVAAASLLGALKKREKDWMMPQAFNVAENANNAANKPAVSQTSTTQVDIASSKALNPKAAEFKVAPSSEGQANGETVLKRRPIEAEDGEIDDASVAKTGNPEALARVAKSSEVSQSDVSAEKVHEPNSNVATSNPKSGTNKDTSGAEMQSSKSAPLDSSKRLPSSRSPPRPSNPSKPAINRTPSSQPTHPRPHHELPSRPEVSQTRTISDHRINPRANERLPPDHRKDSRFPEHQSHSSQGAPIGERLHESGRTDGRLRSDDRDRLERYGGDGVQVPRPHVDNRGAPAMRDLRHLEHDRRNPNFSADARDTQEQTLRRADLRPLDSKDRDNMLPPRTAQHPDRAAPIHSDQEPSREAGPQRPPDRRPENPRYADFPRSEHNSRGASPNRVYDRPGTHEARRGERRYDEGRRTPADTQHPRTRYDDLHTTPAPRSDRLSSTGTSGPVDRFRDAPKGPNPNGSTYDMNHGRLNQDKSRDDWQGESSYGRLNPPSSGQEVPSGPRLSNGKVQSMSRGGRNASSPHESNTKSHSYSSTSNTVPSSHTNDRPPINGQTSRQPLQEPDKPSPKQPKSDAVSSDSTSEVTGIHPDRLKAMQGGSIDRPEQGRGSRNPPAVSTTTSTPGRGPLPSPIQASPTGRGGPPPSGPALTGDRNRDKRFAGIQNVLQQTNGPQPPNRSAQGASIKGRSGRLPPSPSAPGPPHPGQPRDPREARDSRPLREDLFAGRSNGPAPHPTSEDGRGRHGPPTREGPPEGERRSTRHRSRSSHGDRSFDGSGSQYRERERGLPRDDQRGYYRDEPPPFDGRPGNGMERDSRRPPAPLERDLRGGPPVRRSPRDAQLDGRGMPDVAHDRREEERRDGGGSMRKRGRGGDEPQGDWTMDNKRPRR